MSKEYIISGLFLYLFTLSAFASNLNEIPPEQVVSNFYHWYTETPDEPGEKSDNELKNYVTERLIINTTQSMKCNYDYEDMDGTEHIAGVVSSECQKERECKASVKNFICNWGGTWVETDVNYFTKSQDVYPTWSTDIQVTPITKTENEAAVNVSLGAGIDPIMQLQVLLILENGQWKISNVSQ